MQLKGLWYNSIELCVSTTRNKDEDRGMVDRHAILILYADYRMI